MNPRLSLPRRRRRSHRASTRYTPERPLRVLGIVAVNLLIVGAAVAGLLLLATQHTS